MPNCFGSDLGKSWANVLLSFPPPIGANGTVSAFDSWKLFRLSHWQRAFIPCWHIIIYHLDLAQCYFGDVLSGAGSVWCRPGLVLASILVDNHGAAAAAVPTRPPAIVEWTTRGLHTNCAPEPHPPIRVLLSCSKYFLGNIFFISCRSNLIHCIPSTSRIESRNGLSWVNGVAMINFDKYDKWSGEIPQKKWPWKWTMLLK